jgi:hypothetical protein
MIAVAVLAAAGVVSAEELKSGPAAGDAIAPFYVVKVAGASDDGVEVGKELCYRCKYGSRPMVMVFARKPSDGLTALVKELDEAVAKNSEKQLKAFVNIVGENKEDAEKAAKDLAKKDSFANVPIVVPEETENGPDNYGLNPKAEVTVIVAVKGKVTASHGFAATPDDAQLKEVLEDISKAVQ